MNNIQLNSLSFNDPIKHFFAQAKKNLAIILEKIQEIAKKVFKIIKTIVTFPLRFLGSKTFSIPGLLLRLPEVTLKHSLGLNNPHVSFKDDLLCDRGYHRFGHLKLTPEEAKQHILYTCAAAAVQNNKPQWLTHFGYTPISPEDFNLGFENKDCTLFDFTTGLKVALYQKKDHVLIAFGAFGSHKSQYSNEYKKESNAMNRHILATATSSLFGMNPTLFTKADKFVRSLRNSDKFKNCKITVTGQSLGGAIASYVSLKQRIPGIALNSFPLGPGLQCKIGKKKLLNADNVLTHIISTRDIFADLSTALGVLDMGVNLLGIKTPANFGKKLQVDALYDSRLDEHYYLIGSLFAKAFPDQVNLCKRLCSPGDKGKEAMKELASKINQIFK